MKLYNYYQKMTEQPHLLIAGATGSGKSVLINALIYTALAKPGSQFALIDPKKVSLLKFARIGHTVMHATEREQICEAFSAIRDEVDRRFAYMARHGEEMLNGPDLYVVIDELMDIMTSYPKQVKQDLQYIAQVGRAARVHVWAATQTPIREVLPTAIKCNFDARVALRTRSAQDSRNILGINGAEMLPRWGYGIYMDPDHLQPVRVNLPKIEDAELQDVIPQCQKQSRSPFRKLFGRR